MKIIHQTILCWNVTYYTYYTITTIIIARYFRIYTNDHSICEILVISNKFKVNYRQKQNNIGLQKLSKIIKNTTGSNHISMVEASISDFKY